MRILFLLIFILFPGIVIAEESGRLSAVVALRSQAPDLSAWLENPHGDTYVEALVLFPPSLGDDVIFGIDQEFLEGVERPLKIKGGDRMGFIGVQRTGHIWITAGTDETNAGNPSKERNWQIISLGQPLKPDTWYLFRGVVNFSTNRFVRFEIHSQHIVESIDLNSYYLDYPNYFPINKRVLASYVHSMRLDYLNPKEKTTAAVYFDSIEAGRIDEKGNKIPFYSIKPSYLLHHPELSPITIPLSAWFGESLKIESYEKTPLFLEQEKSLCKITNYKFDKKTKRLIVCDATLKNISYKDWLKTNP